MQNRGNMKIENLLTEKRILFGSILLAAIILLIVPVFRLLFFSSLLPGDEPYYHIRMAQYIRENGIPDQDPLIQRPYLLNPYHLLLAGTSFIFGVYYSSILIPSIFGILSIILFYLILNKFKLNLSKKAIILLILIASPAFIFAFSLSNSYVLSLPLLIIGFYFFISMKKILHLISIFIFGLASLLSPINIVVIIFLLFFNIINTKSKIKKFYTASSIMLLVFLVYYLPFYVKYGFQKKLVFISQNIPINLITDLGGEIGFGIFNIFLAIIGLYVVWKIKKQILSYFLLAVLIIISFYYNSMNIYLTFIISIFAGYGFFTLIKMKWKIKTIKLLTIMLIVCGLLFSSISYINRLSNSPPDNEIINSLEWLATQPQGMVFSHYTNGFWIETIANKSVFLDPLISCTPSSDIKLNASNEIFYSRNLEKTKYFLNKYNISYIWIDNAMRQGKVWTQEEQGLLFLFRNSETFKNIYSSKEVEIWKVVR